jgi:hypothetical protein
MEERGGTGSPSLSWEHAYQLADGELWFIRQRVADEADCADIVQDLVIRLMLHPPKDENPWARKRYIRMVTRTVIADHFRRKEAQLGHGVLSPPDLLPERADWRCADEATESLAKSADMEERLSKELHKRVNSMRARATAETCPVEGHRCKCPDQVLLAAAEALTLAADRLVSDLEGHDGHSALERPRHKLREVEIRRRVAELGCSERAAKKWVERVILPCFDWWVYRAIAGLDGFDVARYARMHKIGRESWAIPLPYERAAAQQIIQEIQIHRWMVLRHIKLVDGRWDSGKYGIKRMRELLPAHPDLDGIIRIRMPAVAGELDWGEKR